jgi:DNA-binding MarR family transcriptional regulator
MMIAHWITSKFPLMEILARTNLQRRARTASASHELSWTESAVMARLAKDGPATTADLARAEGMKPQSMGTTIAALEGMGMVEHFSRAVRNAG